MEESGLNGPEGAEVKGELAGKVEDSGFNEPEGVGVEDELAGKAEDSGLNEPEAEGAKGELAGEAGDKPFSRLALVFGVGFAVVWLAWTIMRTISEGFGWPYYGWPTPLT